MPPITSPSEPRRAAPRLPSKRAPGPPKFSAPISAPSPAPNAAPSRYLKNRAVIFAVGVSIVAACGALLGAAFRQQTQQASASGRSLFSTFSSSQAIRSEATIGSGGGSSSSSSSSQLSQGEGATEGSDGPAKTPSNPVSGDSKSDIKAQIDILERRRAGLWQQRLITEKKMEGLRERQAAKAERERENEKREDEAKEQRLRKDGR